MFDLKFHHVQLTIPIGKEPAAKEFYCQILGFREIEKPEPLKPNGGFWLETGNIQLHIGVEDGVERWRTKQHPAFETKDLIRLKKYLLSHNVELKTATPIPGFDRCYIYDPFGNRIELIQVIQ
ncbi:MAG: VOC family protein [Chloroflexota bacterium]